jgi:cobalt-zinc-cadmium efflux system outer membrane protein
VEKFPTFLEQRNNSSQSVDFPLTTAYRLKAIEQERQALELRIRDEERNVKCR